MLNKITNKKKHLFRVIKSQTPTYFTYSYTKSGL